MDLNSHSHSFRVFVIFSVHVYIASSLVQDLLVIDL